MITKYHVSKNLFDRNNEQEGYYIDSSGNLIGGGSGAGWSVSDYIKIEENTQYTFNPNTTQGASARHCFYNANKQPFVSYIIPSGQQTFTTPSDAKYARFSYRDSSTDIMLNTGSQPLPYEPYGDTWNRIPYRQYHLNATSLTSDEITTDGSNVAAIIEGSLSQASVPSPSNPVYPSECGDTTANLFDEDYTSISSAAIYKAINAGDGDFTLSSNAPLYNDTAAVLFLLAGNVSSGISTPTNGVSVNQSRTVTAINGYVTIAYRTQGTINPDNYNTMLNKGSTAPSTYIPYGYILPIEINSTTIPIYFGEDATTRRIKKVILTGEEIVNNPRETTTSGLYCFPILYTSLNMEDIVDFGERLSDVPYPHFVCTHFEMKPAPQSADYFYNISDGQVGGNSYIYDSGTNRYIIFCKSGITTSEEFKAWLAQQYANGTPVCVWYVLAEPTTTTLNEPLRKIGTYADTVSITGIPTTAGQNTFTVNTTLSPSDIKVSNFWETEGYEKTSKNNNWQINNSVAYWQQFTIAQLQQKTIYELQGGN